MQQTSRAAAESLGSVGQPFVPTFTDQLYGLRDRLLASAWFQRWAASSPFTRLSARRYARASFDLCAGFVYSQVLLACVRLRVFDILADKALTVPELANRLELSFDATTRLVQAAQSLGLLAARSKERVCLGMLGAALRGNPGALMMIEHHGLLYADLADPVALLRGEVTSSALARYWPYSSDADVAGLGEAQIAPYTALMSKSQSLIADDILDAYDFSRHQRLLDIGGGDGSFLAAAASRYPGLQLCLFDLPAVAAKAASRFSALGIEDRAAAIGGDFKSGVLPTGADVVSLVRVALDHDDETVIALLRAIGKALRPGGALVIAEPLRGLKGAETVGDAYFNFYLLAMGRGRVRSEAELSSLLLAAGFQPARRLATRRPILTGLVISKRSNGEI